MNENETGLVKKILNNRILVECEAVNMCNSCSEQRNCNMSGESKKREIWIDNAADVSIDVNINDRILFKFKDSSIIYASVLLYVIPIVFLFLGIIIGYRLHSFFNIDSELSSIIFGSVGLIVSFVFIKIYSILVFNKERFKPIFIKKVD
ncbi:MAG: SoxR reducing system RseC family protein [Leptospirales bacterium]|nr:SoxR reducing system RseC family protein [Leptospirales bacterium]